MKGDGPASTPLMQSIFYRSLQAASNGGYQTRPGLVCPKIAAIRYSVVNVRRNQRYLASKNLLTKFRTTWREIFIRIGARPREVPVLKTE